MRAVAPQADTMARFGYAVAPESWWEVVLTLLVLYGAFIGIPALAGIWAALRIWHRL